MAEQVDLGDGNTVPQWVTEETGKQLVEQFKKLTDKNDKLADAFEKFIKTTTKHQKDSEEQEKEQKDALDEIKKAIGKDTIGMGKKGGSGGGDGEKNELNPFVKGFYGALKDLAIASGTLAVQAMGLLAKSAYNVGDTLSDLAQTGIGITESEVSQTTLTLQNLNRLGLSASEASGYLQNFSGAVQIAGQARIVAFNQALAQSTNFGVSLGLTFTELTSQIGEDLELRQKLGILSEMNEAASARRSADLFQMQLAATALLGKSIADIRAGANAGLEENEYFATVVNTMANNLGSDFADQFQTQARVFGSELTGRGVSQELVSSINEMFAKPIAFMGDSGKELLDAFTVFGSQAGVDLVSGMENIQNLTQQLANTDDANEARAINKRILAEREKFVKDLSQASVNLGKNMDPKELSIFFDSLGSTGRQFALMIPELSQVAGKELQTVFLNNLLTSTKTFDQSLNMIKGGVSAALTGVTDGVAPLMNSFATALHDSSARAANGALLLEDATSGTGASLARYGEEHKAILAKFIDNEEEINEMIGKPIKNVAHLTEEQAKTIVRMTDENGNAINIITQFQDTLRTAAESVARALFGLEGEGADLTQTIREKIQVRLEAFSKWFEDGGGEKVVGALKFFGGILVGIASPFLFVIDSLTTFGSWLVGGADNLDGFGKTLGMLIGTMIIANAGLKMFGAPTIGGMIGNKIAGNGFFGGGGGKGKGMNIPDGKKAAASGAGFGAGAKGLAAFGLAAAGVGVALFGLTNAVETFAEMSWGEIGKGLGVTAVALTAIGAALIFVGPVATASALGLAAIGVALAGIGIAAAGIGYAAEAIGGLFATDHEAEADAYETKINASAEAAERLAGIPKEQIEATAAAIRLLGDSLEYMANKVGKDGSWWNPFDNDSGADLDKQNEQVDVFHRFALIDGSNLLNVATGISNITDAYGRFAELDGDAIAKNANAIKEFNQVTGNTRMDRIMDFGLNLITGSGANSPTPDSNMVPTALSESTASNAGSAQFADGSTASLLKKIADNTEMTARKTGQVKTVIENA